MTSRAYGIAAIALLCALMFAWGGNVQAGLSARDCYMMGQVNGEREAAEEVSIHNYERIEECAR